MFVVGGWFEELKTKDRAQSKHHHTAGLGIATPATDVSGVQLEGEPGHRIYQPHPSGDNESFPQVCRR